MVRILWVCLGLGFSACVTTLPPVFTAAALEENATRGPTYRFQVEANDEVRVEVLRFETGAACRYSARIEGAEGADEVVDCSYEELASHGVFPKEGTVIEDGEVTTPAGTFVAKIYNVAIGNRVSRYWFAIELAGPPVRFEVFELGERTYLSELISIAVE